jgi:CheY-like chemotaxis protein/HPt (histidine-containing phosphotransfer) domain-containing protein
MDLNVIDPAVNGHRFKPFSRRSRYPPPTRLDKLTGFGVHLPMYPALFGMDATMSADHSLIPFALPTDADLDMNPGAARRSHFALSLPRPQTKAGMLLFLWLLVSGLLAMTALYHVVANGPGARLLSWTATAGAVALLLGATFISQSRALWKHLAGDARHRELLTTYPASSLLLIAFVVPTLQLLLTMVVTQDLGYTTYALLLLIGYGLLAEKTEAVLLYTTITLAAWCACALRIPQGEWVNYVLPWAGAVGLALFIHGRLALAAGTPARRPLSSNSVIDVNLEEPLRQAIADRDRAFAAKKSLEQELTELRLAHHQKEDYLPVLQHLTQSLAQDASLQDIGPRWLEQLLNPLKADYAAVWIKEPNTEPRLTISTSATASTDETLLHEVLQSGTLIQRHLDWAIPLDLGMQGKAVLLLQGVHHTDTQQADRLLHTSGSLLSIFLRWQCAEAESDALTQDAHQHKERAAALHHEMASLQNAHIQTELHLQSQLKTALAETERFQKLVEEAQTEHDTLTQLLDEAEQELKKLQTSAGSSEKLKQLEIDRQVAEASAETARNQMLKLEQQVKTLTKERQAIETNWASAEQQRDDAEAARQNAERELAQAQAEWEKENSLTERLTMALKALPTPVAFFDRDGHLLAESNLAQAIRGNTRNMPGEHPLFQLISKDKLKTRSSWQLDALLQGTNYQVSVTPIWKQQELEGYLISAATVQIETKPVMEDLAGPRFFGGLADTLEPPLAQIIDHADHLLDAATDADTRRQALVGLLQQGRHVRRLLTQAVDYAQLEAGRIAVVPGPLSPWKVAQQVVAQLRPSAEEKGLELELKPLGTLPASITCDAARLTSLLLHLVSQAIRGTSTGNLTLKIGMEQAKSSNRLRIDIDGPPRSYGTSFAAEFASQLARKQAQALKITLEEQPSRSSLFLPVTSAELMHLLPSDKLAWNDQPESTTLSLDPLHGKALIVSDGQEPQRVITYQLERLGLRCEVIADGEQALNRAVEDRFDLILWDAAKRDISLVEAGQKLRGQFYQGAILGVGPVQSSTQRDDFLAAGGDGVLARPIVLATWRHTIKSMLPQGTVTLPLTGETITSEFQTDREFASLIRSYVTKLPGQVAEMRAALQVADVARLIRLAHALVDGGDLYGYPRLSETGSSLEKALLSGKDASDLAAFVDQLDSQVVKMERGLRQSSSQGYLALPGPLTRAA